MKNFSLCFSFCIIFVSSCYAQNNATFVLKTPSGKSLSLEVARTKEQHQKGLMFRDQLDKNVGMLFIFQEERELSFWMKNTSIPLSIAFIDSTGTVINIEHMVPFSLDTIFSLGKAKYAIEVNRGMFSSFEIYTGTTLSLPQ